MKDLKDLDTMMNHTFSKTQNNFCQMSRKSILIIMRIKLMEFLNKTLNPMMRYKM